MRADLRTNIAKFYEEAEKRPFVANKVGFWDVRAKPESLVSSYAGRFTVVPVSAKRGDGLEQLREGVYKSLDIVRVYTKPPGGEADLTEPSVVRRGRMGGGCGGESAQGFRPQPEVCPGLGLGQVRWAEGQKRLHPAGGRRSRAAHLGL
jgi:hypothetical protein